MQLSLVYLQFIGSKNERIKVENELCTVSKFKFRQDVLRSLCFTEKLILVHLPIIYNDELMDEHTPSYFILP